MTVSVYWHQKFSPRSGGGECTVSSPKRITEKEYRALSAKKDKIDTPEALAEIASEDNKAKRRRKLEEQLAAITPKCHKCRRDMVRRKSKHGYFWGCTGFPQHCDGTASLSNEASDLLDKLKNL